MLQTSVASYNDKLERLNGDDQSRSAIVDRLKASDESLEKVKAEEQILREQLSTLQAKDAKKYEDVPALKEVPPCLAHLKSLQACHPSCILTLDRVLYSAALCRNESARRSQTGMVKPGSVRTSRQIQLPPF